MNPGLRILLTCTFMEISILFLSCGASHKLIDDVKFHDQSFTYHNLKSHGLIVGGVVSDVVTLSRDRRQKYGTTFSNVLIEKLKDVSMIQITNPSQLIDKMGTNNYFHMMEEYDSLMALSRNWADTLHAVIPEVQYILFADIVNENIVDESHDQYVESKDGKELETEYRKTYFITVEFHIYDLIRQELVWENSIFNKAQRTESRTTQTGCLESCVDNLFQNILFGEPAEISREEVFVKIVEKFAEDIVKV